MFEQIKNSFQINKFKIKNENDNINLIPKNNLKFWILNEFLIWSNIILISLIINSCEE